MKIKSLKTLKAVSIVFLLSLFLNACSQNQNKNESEAEGVTATTVKAPKTPIHDAVIIGDLAAVKQHIAANTDLNKKESIGGATPLILATVFGRDKIAKELIENNAKLNIQNNDGSTAVHTAAFFCRTEILEMLLEAGADKSVKNNFGATALESTQAPFEAVEGIYNMMAQQLKGMGLQLDMERIEKTRPQVVDMLK